MPATSHTLSNMDLSFLGYDIPTWFLLYGSFALFILLSVGIFGLPVPEETVLILAGISMKNGDLAIIPVFIAAYLGTVLGITISYLLGRVAGHSFLREYGRFFPKLKSLKTLTKWTLLVGYLIPGLRHFTGIFAGFESIKFKEFALWAYSGAFFWVSFYLSIGFFSGNYFLFFANTLQNLEFVMDLFTLFLTLAFIGYLIYKIKIRKNGS